MEAISITSLEQVPSGLTLLFKRIDELEARLSGHTQSAQSPGKEFLTRKETAKVLNVTLATLNEYTKSGKIVANRIGNRVLYRDSDIQSSLRQVKTSNAA